MCPINNDKEFKSKRGRPSMGIESRSVERKIRIEPYLDSRLGHVCRLFGLSKSEAIRQGIILYLNQAEKIIKENAYDNPYEHL